MPRVPKYKKPLFAVRNSKIQGKGAFAVRRIRKGQRIIEYVGERIGPDEESRRYDEAKMKRHHTFLFGIDNKVSIDAAVGGNAARFINHSCDPNCEAVEEDKRIFIEAIKNIQPGTELVYDYNFTVEPPITVEEIEYYECRCGSTKCRGTILKVPKKTLRKLRAKLEKKRAAKAAGSKKKSARKKSAKKSSQRK